MDNKQQQNNTFISGLLNVFGMNFVIFFVGIFILLFAVFSNYDARMTHPFQSNFRIIDFIASLPTFFLGFSQWLYIIPWIRKLKANNELEKRKGVIAGGIITLLINGSCYGSLVLKQILH